MAASQYEHVRFKLGAIDYGAEMSWVDSTLPSADVQGVRFAISFQMGSDMK
jgi:hypothetical protein